MGTGTAVDGAIAEALRRLGVRRLVLSIHDACFPASADEDTGRGTPYGEGAADFLRFARGLGFDGAQLGPQGETSLDNPSPYDGAAFARSTLSISLAALARDERWGGLVDAETLAEIAGGRPGDGGRSHHAYAWAAQRRALATVWRRFDDARRRVGAGAATPLDRAVRALIEPFARFRATNTGWLERDGLFEVLAESHGTGDWTRWGTDARLFPTAPHEAGTAAARRRALAAAHADLLERHAFLQFVAHEQHRELRARAREMGLALRGDLQIGWAHRDRWSLGAAFLRDWVMGAPPSRTNPAGQAWGYPVLDPEQYVAADGATAGLARAVFRARMAKAFAEYDGLRIDHPHGLVCPWVYRADAADPHAAVALGARLFESPAVAEHPGLARYAIARPEQLAHEPGVPRYADGWVRDLEPAQVDRYAILIDDAVAAARVAGRDRGDLACEVLSTCPYPLRRVLERHGLGRFRVTQKANLDDTRDPYRVESAAPADWVMIGTHDTRPIWRLLPEWQASGEARRQAAFLARRLAPSPAEVEPLERELAGDPGALAHAKLAELFASPAENVLVFFADLLGIAEELNRPGVQSAENWSVRVPPDWREAYRRRCAAGLALDLPRALELALRAPAGGAKAGSTDLLSALRAASAALRGR